MSRAADGKIRFAEWLLALARFVYQSFRPRTRASPEWPKESRWPIATLPSCIQRVVVHAEMPRPTWQRHFHSDVLNGDVGSLVVSLFNLRNPSAIFRRVVSVIVRAVDRHARRFFAHVREEILELRPAFTNRDAATAVILVIVRIGVRAARMHVTPRTIRRRSAHAVSSTHMPRRKLLLSAAAFRERRWLPASAETQFDRIGFSHVTPPVRCDLVRGPLNGNDVVGPRHFSRAQA